MDPPGLAEGWALRTREQCHSWGLGCRMCRRLSQTHGEDWVYMEGLVEGTGDTRNWEDWMHMELEMAHGHQSGEVTMALGQGSGDRMRECKFWCQDCPVNTFPQEF